MRQDELLLGLKGRTPIAPTAPTPRTDEPLLLLLLLLLLADEPRSGVSCVTTVFVATAATLCPPHPQGAGAQHPHDAGYGGYGGKGGNGGYGGNGG